MVSLARLISGVMVALFQHTLGPVISGARSMTRAGASKATRPLHGEHYRLSRAPRYGGHCNNQALEVLCPDGRWRRFVWTTNHTSPLCEDGRNSLMRSSCRRRDGREELARQVYYMSDKFVGPTYLGPESAPDEGSLRDTTHIGLYMLDPDCRESNAQLGLPWHGRDYCAVMDDQSVPLSWADKFDDVRLLPCYDTVAGRRVRADRPGLTSRLAASALRIGIMTAIGTAFILLVWAPFVKSVLG